MPTVLATETVEYLIAQAAVVPALMSGDVEAAALELARAQVEQVRHFATGGESN